MSDEKKEEGYSVNVTGPGLTIDREISKELAERVVMLLMTGQAPATPTVAAPPPTPSTGYDAPPAAPPTGDMSVREYLNETAAQRVPDKITAMGLYLRDVRKRSHFKRADMVEQFQAAHERVPKNLSRDIAWAAKAGWIATKAGTTDTYYVTNSGSEAVAARFSKEVVKKTRGLASGGKKKKKTSSKK